MSSPDGFGVSASISKWPSDVLSPESTASPLFPYVCGPLCSLYLEVCACRSFGSLLSCTFSPRGISVASINLVSLCMGCVFLCSSPSERVSFPCICSCPGCWWGLPCTCLACLSLVISLRVAVSPASVVRRGFTYPR
jgi:hypothetical protein